MNEYNICRACIEDLQDILQLQYLAYQSEAALFNKEDIPPLKQTLDEVVEEFYKGVILKMVDAGGLIIGSIRAWELEGTVFIGKLMIHPDYRHHGYGTKLLSEIERYYPRKRYELFTSIRSIDNIRLYQRMGYHEFERRVVDDNLEFVFMEKEANFCQSCGMPLTKEILGTNVDGNKNEDYCMYCYKDGRFLQDCTMDEMIEHCVQLMEQQEQRDACINPAELQQKSAKGQFVDEVNKQMPKPMNREEYMQMLHRFFPMLKRWRK